MPLRIRRGTDQDRLAFTPLEGELIYTTDTKTVFIGDGATPGGISVGADGGPFGGFLGQNIDLNGFSIIGLGNINTVGNQSISGNLAVGGTITAQGNIIANGNITLGNGGGDVIVIAGDIDSNLIPGSNQLSLGSVNRPWGTLYVNGIDANGLIEGDLEGNLIKIDSTLAYNSLTDTFSGNFEGNLLGDVKGSVFGNDSSVLVDGLSGTHYGIFDGNLVGNIISINNNFAYDYATNTFSGIFTGNILSDTNITAYDSFTNTFIGDFVGDIIGDVRGNLVDASNVIAFDYFTSTFNGTFFGSSNGTFRGDATGSLFADDSSLRVSGLDNYISNGNIVLNENVITSVFNKIKISNLEDPFPTELEINMPNGTGLTVNGITDGSLFTGATSPAMTVNTIRGTSLSINPLGADDVIFSFNFQGSDTNGNIITSSLIIPVVDNNLPVTSNAVPGKLAFVTLPDDSGDFKLFSFDSSGRMAINKYDASETLDVEGNGVFSGSVTAASFKGSFVADDSSIVVDGVSGAVTAPTVTASTFVQFPVYSNPTARDAAIPTPAAGMVVFVTDSTGAGGPPKLQANTNSTTGGWVDL